MSWTLLNGAIPFAWHAREKQVDWIAADRLDWSRPFFRDTVAAARAVGSVAFRTGADALDGRVGQLPSLLVFSTGRAGSTVLTRLLDRPGIFLCLREPDPVNLLLRDIVGGTSARIGACARALSHAVPGGRFALKFSSWNLHVADRLLAAFPNVPAVLLRRDPAATMASFTQEAPAWMDHDAVLPGLPTTLAGQVGALMRCADWLSARGMTVIDHDDVAAAAAVLAAQLGLAPLLDVQRQAISRVHARHPARAFAMGG